MRTGARGSRRSLVAALAAMVVGLLATAPAATAAGEPVQSWLTTVSGSSLVQPMVVQTSLAFGPASSNPTAVTVDPATSYQTIDGFGGALTDAAAQLIWNSPQRDRIIQSLFGAGGFTVVRLPIGATDLSWSDYSYDDQCCGLGAFSIAPALSYTVPVLRQALAIDPGLKVIGTPWSAPGWMKFAGTMTGGCSGAGNYLINADYALYAGYLAATVAAYRAQGIPFYALSMQNEPENCNATYPTMNMQPGDQSTFALNLRAALNAAGFPTVKIIAYDHNWYEANGSPTTYPQQVLAYANGQAQSAINGVAYHCYISPDGASTVQSTFHAQYPSQEIYFTECTGGTWATNSASNLDWNLANTLIGPLRNWARTSLYWSLALDPNGGPHLGGCGTCRGMITIDNTSGTYSANAEYYAWAHLARLIQPGAVRIDSTEPAGQTLRTLAARNPDGSVALIVLNYGGSASSFAVDWGNESLPYTLPAGAVVSLRWQPAASPAPAWYEAVARGSGDCVDATGWGTSNGTAVQQWPCTGGANQQWQLIPVGGGYYELLNRNAADDGEAFDVSGGPGATGNGAQLQLWSYGATSNEQFRPVSMGGGWYELVARNSGKCLDITNKSTAAGARLQQWDCTGAANQQFREVAQP